MRNTNRRSGFTLIELMIAVAIVGVLASIAMPKFVSLLRVTSEGSAKGNLGAVRSAMSVYYADQEGNYPSQLAALTVTGTYMSALPPAQAPYYHADSSAETDGALNAATDAGGWYYDNAASDVNVGLMVINCTHTDTQGNNWTSY
jgi:prepilin-type N-terminal cleavage/methylation domain-containing protein